MAPCSGQTSMAHDEQESAFRSLASHPDQCALACVEQQLHAQLKIPRSLLRMIANHLQLKRDLKSQFEAALFWVQDEHGGGGVGGLVLRVAASFAHACGLAPFPAAALAAACGYTFPTLDEHRLLFLERIRHVYWFERSIGASHRGSHPLIVSEVFGRLMCGKWFYYKDRHPSRTNSKNPQRIGGICIYGGSFHRDYVALAADDLHSLLGSMNRQDVMAIVNAAPKPSSILSNRADKLLNLFKVMESASYDSDSETWPYTYADISQAGPLLAQALVRAAEADYSLWTHAGEHDPDGLWEHLAQAGAIKLWQKLRDGGGIVREGYWQWRKSSLFALRNCLRNFHTEPRVPIDVPLDKLRYTQCTINSVFSHGPHAGMPLQRTVEELSSLRLGPQSEHMVLNVVLHRGKLFSLNNRRLWCLQQHALSHRHLFVRVLVWPLARGVLFNGVDICDKFCRALTTTNEGTSVEWSSGCQQQIHREASASSIVSSASFATAGHEPQNLTANVANGHLQEDFEFAAAEHSSRPPSPPASLSPQEAAEIAGQRWASWVQNRAWKNAFDNEYSAAGIVILRFSRHEDAWENAVLQSSVAKQAMLQGAELCPTWAHGAKVLLPHVGPEPFDQGLERFNVVLREEDEHELLRELEEKLPHKNRQLKAGSGRSVVPDRLSLFNISQGDASSSNETVLDMAGMRVVRTFIDIPRLKQPVKSSSTW
eukprot:TRINITY_DN76102_c0_g1_i1.p1 TRINITY_DN76102_c0_g1~~TRINITY_DN76102_c0_g1_i1.p1  ORF type:complete len:780 (-),score=123.95 TRINITY_DN76102_c0_g1_i1:80-2212(-)